MRQVSMLSVVFVSLASVCPATTIAVTPGPGGSQNSAWNGNVTIGWQFTLTSPVTVTDLGFFDADDDGLSDPHEVGIWDSLETLLGSATVPPGIGATLLNGFRFVPVAPFLLAPGSYTIGSYGNVTSPDEFRFGISGSTAIPGLTLGGGVQSTFGPTSLSFPGQVNGFAAEGYFGPNFGINGAPAPVPEPSTLSLVGITLGALLLARRKKAAL
jgi:hypothetical protein